MTLQQIDEALADWNNRLAAVAETILQLQADPTYKLLSASRTSASRLQGLTATRVETALAGMPVCHEQFAALQSALDHAARLRAAVPRIFGAEAKLGELQHFLLGRSVLLPVSVTPGTGIAGADHVSLDDLLRAMTSTLSAVRTAVLAVSEAWSELAGKMEEASLQLQHFDAARQQLGGEFAVTLARAAHLLQKIRSRQQDDPLGAVAEFDLQVKPLLARAQLMQARANQNLQSLERARSRSGALVRLQNEILAARAETQRKIANCQALPQPIPDEQLRSLDRWLERLTQHQAAGLLEAVEVGLRNWMIAADDCASLTQTTLAACRAPVEQRNELRGRLEALKAKARVYGVAEAAPMAALAHQAEKLLYSRPTDVERAAGAVAAYEAMLQTSNKEASRR